MYGHACVGSVSHVSSVVVTPPPMGLQYFHACTCRFCSVLAFDSFISSRFISLTRYNAGDQGYMCLT